MTEKRKYVRLNSVFPVEFRFKESELIQGFTRNVSKDGLCIEVNMPSTPLPLKEEALLSLSIDIPLSKRPVRAKGRVMWLEKTDDSSPRYLIGVRYEQIGEPERKRIINYARKKKMVPYMAGTLLLFSFVWGGGIFIHDLYVQKKSLKASRELVKVKIERDRLQWQLTRLDRQISELKEELRKKPPESSGVNDSVMRENKKLREELARLIEDRERIQKKIRKVKRLKQYLERVDIHNLYRWIKVHQNKNTGLISSFEGASELKNYAFTYDQSLAAQVFLIFGDYGRAELILNFFRDRAERVRGGFANAYSAASGEPKTYEIHTGPTVWVGLAALQYMLKTENTQYETLVHEITEWLLRLQDGEGGIRGGPEIEWYSTEHNLDSYAFFAMMYQWSGKEKFRTTVSQILKWIREHTYTGPEGLIKRGKGDSTIATDTFSWAIAAIGPEKLLEAGMNPDDIMKFAEDHCRVTADFTRPDGKTVKVTGFDFAVNRHLGRKGVISTEWTAQMIVAFRIMEKFYLDLGNENQAQFYESKAAFYENELEKLIISSPSRTGQGAICLPYASQPETDTGHGWKTPSGKQTGSIAGTAYMLFAKKGYNPLKAEGKRPNSLVSE